MAIAPVFPIDSAFGGRHQYPSFTHGRTATPTRLTAKQREVLGKLVDDKITLFGRTLTRVDIMAIINGRQLPKDRRICEALDIPA